jgi:hypothetical protein
LAACISMSETRKRCGSVEPALMQCVHGTSFSTCSLE